MGHVVCRACLEKLKPGEEFSFLDTDTLNPKNCCVCGGSDIEMAPCIERSDGKCRICKEVPAKTEPVRGRSHSTHYVCRDCAQEYSKGVEFNYVDIHDKVITCCCCGLHADGLAPFGEDRDGMCDVCKTLKWKGIEERAHFVCEECLTAHHGKPAYPYSFDHNIPDDIKCCCCKVHHDDMAPFSRSRTKDVCAMCEELKAETNPEPQPKMDTSVHAICRDCWKMLCVKNNQAGRSYPGRDQRKPILCCFCGEVVGNAVTDSNWTAGSHGGWEKYVKPMCAMD
jgi:hypothetical protein